VMNVGTVCLQASAIVLIRNAVDIRPPCREVSRRSVSQGGRERIGAEPANQALGLGQSL
jgi:hypothetical protein